MRRGSTSTITINTIGDFRAARDLTITFKQGGSLILTKHRIDCEVTEKSIVLELNPEETSLFNSRHRILFRVSAVLDKKPYTSKAMYIDVEPAKQDPSSSATPSDTIPLMDDEIASVGIEYTFARGDHVHPSDDNKVSVYSRMTNSEIDEICN